MEKMFGPSKTGRHIELPPISQIVMVTKDCNRMAKEYSSLLGIGTWNIYEFVPEKTWFMGKPAYLKLLIAKAMSNSIELVLQQPLEASFSLYDDFLSTRGEGVLNFAFNISNYKETFDKFLKSGFKPLLECDTYVETPKGYLKSCHFDTRSVYGILLEIRWRSWSI
jgi:methylmalonyl-CoA/ethylmalonyl-CoA epimerase